MRANLERGTMSHHAGLPHEQTCGRVAGQGTEKSQRQEGQDGDQDDERPQAQALAQAAAHGRARNTEKRGALAEFTG